MADNQLYVAEITIRGLVLAPDEEKAAEDVLANTFLDVPLGTILNHEVKMKAKAVDPTNPLPVFDPTTDPMNDEGNDA
jgi:hypothetical protein